MPNVGSSNRFQARELPLLHNKTSPSETVIFQCKNHQAKAMPKHHLGFILSTR